MAHTRVELSSGWEFKQQDDKDWLPVRRVPSEVHVDLLAHKKYVRGDIRLVWRQKLTMLLPQDPRSLS